VNVCFHGESNNMSPSSSSAKTTIETQKDETLQDIANVSYVNGNNAIHKIIGGHKAKIKEYPWFALGDGCGGSLIAPSWVLTAAHCKANFDVALNVTVGALCKKSGNCNQYQEHIEVEGFFRHPKYDSYTLTNDLALVKLKYNSSIPPFPLLDTTDYNPFNYSKGKTLWALGFGITSPRVYQTSLSDDLLDIEVRYVPRPDCKDAYVELGYPVDKSMVCAAPHRYNGGTCKGDSGGPLYDKENDLIIGVLSWANGCAEDGYPSVFASVEDEIDWMREIIDRSEGHLQFPHQLIIIMVLLLCLTVL